MNVVQMVLHQRNMLGRRRQHIRIEDKFAASFLLVFVRSVCTLKMVGWEVICTFLIVKYCVDICIYDAIDHVQKGMYGSRHYKIKICNILEDFRMY